MTNVSWLISLAQNKQGLADVACYSSTTDVALTMCTFHDWYAHALVDVAFHYPRCFPEAHRPLVMLPDICQCKCCLVDSHTSCVMLYSIGQRCLPDVHMPCKMCAGLGWHCLHEVHKPLLIVPVVGRWLFHQAYSHTPQVICAWHGWCCMSLFDVAYQMLTNHVRCVKP